MRYTYDNFCPHCGQDSGAPRSSIIAIVADCRHCGRDFMVMETGTEPPKKVKKRRKKNPFGLKIVKGGK
jgi:uncharacterized protein (DUF983 family)